MKSKIFVLLLFCLAGSFSNAFAGWEKKPEFRWMQFYRWDRHFDADGLYCSRFSLGFNYLDAQGQPLFKLIPFFEMRRNLDVDLWERRELGMEIGKDILPFLYLSERVQHVWKNEEWIKPQLFQKENTAEAITRLMLSRKFFNKNSFYVKGFIIEDYTYDIDDGGGKRNEVIIGAGVPLGKHWESACNWRHIDRIHFFDTDTFEVSLTLVF